MIAATTNNTWIKPPPIFNKRPNSQKNTTIPPIHLKNPMSFPPFSFLDKFITAKLNFSLLYTHYIIILHFIVCLSKFSTYRPPAWPALL